MKKFITLAMVLLLMFSLTLTGCGSKVEEPAVTEDPAAEVTGVSQEDLNAKYNEVVTFYGEVFAVVDELGLYGTDADFTEHMDTVNHSIAALGEAIMAGGTTEEANAEMYAVLDEIQVDLENTKGLAESM